MLGRLLALGSLVALTACYAEWDVPRTPRRDPCTQVIEDKSVYVMPTCRTLPVRNPRDFIDDDPATTLR